MILAGCIEFKDLPDHVVPLDALLVVKCLDEDGDAIWVTRATDGLSAAELVGILAAQASMAVEAFNNTFIDEDEEDAGADP